ncbi:hypothetical protein [Streptomyces chattanoogensis]|uniref:Secreted protein n=1 Tax=Streptomyces chattanoogensis TaxID=66876 RepID=A0A0N0H1H2_9ACTN|nr:hypothetical protein [Streptomyces chattanoogensis]KPC64501.1 hypothetical protein ADL29_11480 [Streptomyces chattanoogensis]
MTPRARTLFAGAGILTAIAGISAPAMASTAKAPAATAPGPPSAVEDFGYPGADKLLAEKKIKLIRGDGHIMLTECTDPAVQIKVSIRREEGEEDLPKKWCFTATGKSGYLALEIPKAFYLETVDHPIRAQLTSAGKTQTVNVSTEEGFKPIGEGVIGAPRATLVELRITG